MKEITLVVIFSCLVFISCSKRSGQQFKEQLTGQWEYEAIAYKWDTIMDAVSVDFGHPKIEKQTIILKTDSGNYKHEYENGKLTDVSLYPYKWIAEFEFLKAESGIVCYYEIDPNVEYVKRNHPRNFGNNFVFSVDFIDILPIIKFWDGQDSSHFMTTYVAKLTADKMVLRDTSDSVETEYDKVQVQSKK